MHPELAALSARYHDLAEAAANHHISIEDATATLEALAAHDAAGAVWRVNLHGNFTRAEYAGMPAEVADPAMFVSHTGPANTATDHHGTAGGFGIPDRTGHESAPNFGSPIPGGFGTQETYSTPQPASGTGVPRPDFTGPGVSGPGFAGPGFSDGGGFVGTDTGPLSAPDPAPKERSLRRPSADRSARSLADAGRRPAALEHTLRGAAFLRRNLIVVLAALVVVVLLGVHFSGSSGTGDKVPTGTGPSATSSPATPDPTPTQPAAAGLPKPGDTSRVTGALTSGDRTAVGRVVAAGDPARLAVAAALFAGLDEAGLALTTGAPARSGSQVVATWKLRSDATTMATIHVTWVKSAGTWKLAAPPLP